MPATAGRVRMPANNRVHSSAALQTHAIWQSVIGHDPYAPKEDKSEASVLSRADAPVDDNAYANYKRILQNVRANTDSNDVRGACKKCGRVGHLKNDCRNFISVKGDGKDKEQGLPVHALPVLDELQPHIRQLHVSDESEEESETSDSDVDSEIERILAERSKKKLGHEVNSSTRKKSSTRRQSSDYDESDSSCRRRRGRLRRSRKSRKDSDAQSEERKKRSKTDKKRKRRHHDYDDDDEYDEHHHHRKSRKDRKRRTRYSDSSDMSSDCPRKKKSHVYLDDSISYPSRKKRKHHLPH